MSASDGCKQDYPKLSPCIRGSDRRPEQEWAGGEGVRKKKNKRKNKRRKTK